jgi:alkylation response protein AidB-like acyl-CoA dehydrogenase
VLVDFGFSEEQEMLRKSVSDFCQKECGHEFLSDMWEDPIGYSRTIWKKMAELGWLGLLIEERYGGTGLTFVDLCVLLEEMGRALLPSPFTSAIILYGQSILYGGNEKQKRNILPAIASGDLIGTLAFFEESGGLEPGCIKLRAEVCGDEYVLNGSKLFVPDAHIANSIVVASRTQEGVESGEGITLFIIDSGTPGLTIEPLKTTYRLRCLSEVAFHNVKVDGTQILGELHCGWHILQTIMCAACSALSLEMVGGAQKALDLSVEYAKIREQFGKPIGSFQAVKHKCAEMLLQLETARSAAYYSAWTISEKSHDMALATSVAKAWCSDAYRKITGDAIQVHGGIGFTWEYVLHMYFKHAQALEASFGNATYHRERIMQLMELP